MWIFDVSDSNVPSKCVIYVFIMKLYIYEKTKMSTSDSPALMIVDRSGSISPNV